MVAATLTATLSFVPLLFVGGILGSFIRAIPVTIISALLISLIVALIFIPLFARFILLSKKQLAEEAAKTARHVEHGSKHEDRSWSSAPMLWAQHHRRREFGVGLTAVLIGLRFVVLAVWYSPKSLSTYFPPPKTPTSWLSTMAYPSGTTACSRRLPSPSEPTTVPASAWENFDKASYYGMANAQSAML